MQDDKAGIAPAFVDRDFHCIPNCQRTVACSGSCSIKAERIPSDVDRAAREWVESVGKLPIIPPSPDEAFKAGAAWARDAQSAELHNLPGPIYPGLWKDAKLGQECEGLIALKTHFTGEPPYVGNEGVLLALREALDELNRLRSARSASGTITDTQRLDHLSPTLHIDATGDEPIYGLFIPGTEGVKSKSDLRGLIDESIELCTTTRRAKDK